MIISATIPDLYSLRAPAVASNIENAHAVLYHTARNCKDDSD